MMAVVPQHIRDFERRLKIVLERYSNKKDQLERLKEMEKEMDMSNWVIFDDSRGILKMTETLLEISESLTPQDVIYARLEDHIHPEVYFGLNSIRRRKAREEYNFFSQKFLQGQEVTSKDCLIRHVELVKTVKKWESLLKKKGMVEHEDSKNLFASIKVGYIVTEDNIDFPKPLIEKERRAMRVLPEEKAAFDYLFRIGSTEHYYVLLPITL